MRYFSDGYIYNGADWDLYQKYINQGVSCVCGQRHKKPTAYMSCSWKARKRDGRVEDANG